MTTYDGVSLRYDPMGNPLTYYNGTRWNMVWENGRQLKAAMTGGKKLSFTYNDEGIRTSKTVNGVVHTYRLNGSQIVAEEWTATDDYGTTAEHMILFLYDAEGAPIGMQYRNQTYAPEIFDVYWFEKNLQGDVVAVYDEDGDKLISYIYDAWGNFTTTYYNDCTSSNPANFNPYRYRSYYYDAETGLYYVSSRYYDPEIGRWINADSVIADVGGSIQGYNMFAYCFNNPVNMTDSSGHWPQWIKDAVDWVNDKVIQPVVNFVKDIAEDINNFDSNNESEEKVLESNYFSSYKGVLVIRTNGDRSGSFGAIFLTSETNNRSNPEDVIRHEYGHTKQLEQLGIVNYALCIGLPSWQQWGTGEYYSKPWEITADIYGGVQSRNHSQSNIDRGFAYLEGSKIIGPLIWVFIE